MMPSESMRYIKQIKLSGTRAPPSLRKLRRNLIALIPSFLPSLNQHNTIFHWNYYSQAVLLYDNCSWVIIFVSNYAVCTLVDKFCL